MSQSELPFGKAQPQPSQSALTVSELTARIRGVVEPQFMSVWVKGEISNCRPATSGHAYFTLKDEGAMLSAACFNWTARNRQSRTPFELRDGLEVLCRGKISIYPPRGSYQLTVEQIEPLGAGALQLAFEQLKSRLSAEGLFDPKRKRALPDYPRHISIVTSPTGAAIRDMLTVLKRRAPQIRVTVIPALVQGDQAPAQILRGLEIANRHSIGEVVVLARGGGSIEDMWCFNDERLARGIAASKLPVISAVGHEIDFSISDFVADVRAPTPSAAAEILSGHWVDAARRLHEAKSRLWVSFQRDLNHRRQIFQQVRARLVSPKDRLREQAQRIDDTALRLERAIRVRMERGHAQLSNLAGRLDALSPLRVLERGYGLVSDPTTGSLVRSASDVRSQQKLKVRFHDGEVQVQAL